MNIFANKTIAWLITIGTIAAIYLSGSLLGAFQLWLKKNGWQTSVAEAILTISAGAVLYYVFIWLNRRDSYHVLMTIFIGLIYLLLILFFAPKPSDRIHFLEYSLLAIFFFYALKFHMRPKFIFPLAWGLTFIAGFGDELLQRSIPTRAFDLHDAVVNGMAAGLALLLVGTVIETKREEDDQA